MNFLQRFLYERHGIDQLSVALFVVAVVLSWIGRLFRLPVLSLLGLVALAIAVFRFLSRDTSRRSRENQRFLAVWYRIAGFFRGARGRTEDRRARASQRRAEAGRKREEAKLYRTFVCPSCGQKLRVPRGKGKIRITCKRCQTKFEAKS